MDAQVNPQVNPSYIMQTVAGFWGSKALLSAVELDVFTALGNNKMTAAQLGDAVGLHPRGTYDFFDTLVALDFLQREGDGPEGKYKNTPQTATFLNKESPAFIGGVAKFFNARLYKSWNGLTTALKTGKPQSDEQHGGKPFFEELYSNQVSLGNFLDAMSGFQVGNFMLLAEKFDFSKYKTVSDIGGALALLSRIVGARHPHLTFTNFDLPPVKPLADKYIQAAKMEERIKAVGGDFFKDDLPKADVITMGNVLHDWNLDKKKLLIRKAYDALPEGGAFIAIENVIDDARRENVFGLLMSLNMLIEVGDGFDYTGADFQEWCSEAGFKRFEIIGLTGPTSAAIAYK